MIKKIVFVFLFFLSSSAVLGFATYKGFFDIAKLDVSVTQEQKGLDHENMKEVVRKNLKTVKGQTLFGVSLNDLYKKVITDPRIKNVKMKRRFPNQLSIEVEPMKAVLSLMSFKHGLHLVTETGRILPVKLSKQDMDLPILRGVNFHKKPGLRLEALQLLKEIPDHGIFSRDNISEIRYDDKDGFSFYLMTRDTLVKIGKDFSSKKSSYVERAMSYLESQQLEGRVIDARFSKKVVVKLRNEP